jgi:hypothetical protein
MITAQRNETLLNVSIIPAVQLGHFLEDSLTNG